MKVKYKRKIKHTHINEATFANRRKLLIMKRDVCNNKQQQTAL